MAYLLELVQEERRQVVGVFGSEAETLGLIRCLPGLHEDPEQPGSFWLVPTEVPELTEIEHRGWVFPLCRSSFSTYPCDGSIDVLWAEIQVFEEPAPAASAYCAGTLSVNGYTYAMADGVAEVRARERLFEEAETHFAARGQVARRVALGSQDGEYVAVAPSASSEPTRLAFLLDPAAVLIRAESASFEDFLAGYLTKLH